MSISRAQRNGLILTVTIPALAPAPASAGPSCRQQQKLIASDSAAGDAFGVSVASSDDTALVGAYVDDHPGASNAGSAYVFIRSGSEWTQQAKLVAADAGADDLFGVSVAVWGDPALVGAINDDHEGGTLAGSAYVFVRSGSVWTQQAKLIASDAAANDRFGTSVALSGDTAVIGAYLDDHAGGIDAGSAYVFVRSGSVWTQQAKLMASDAAANDWFGHSSALSGDTAMVGAVQDDHASGTNAGSAYVFVRSGSEWTQQAKLIASDAAAFDFFGQSAALFGDTALVGATGSSTPGSVYVFVGGGSQWTQQTELIASDPDVNDQFGSRVALSEDTALVGAFHNDHAGGADAGSAYLFARSGTMWTQQSKLTASDAAPGDNFGFSVALAADTAVVGAFADDHAGGNFAGSAYVFT